MENPYSPPRHFDKPVVDPDRIRGTTDAFVFVAWPIVFLLNLIVPLVLGLLTTHEHGRTGMFVAIAAWFGAGWWLCYRWPTAARTLIVGSAIAIPSQLFPIAQIIAGAIAMGISSELGVGIQRDRILTELAGFTVTLLTGGMLIGLAWTLGLFARAVLPTRWFQPARRGTDSTLEEPDGQ